MIVYAGSARRQTRTICGGIRYFPDPPGNDTAVNDRLSYEQYALKPPSDEGGGFAERRRRRERKGWFYRFAQTNCLLFSFLSPSHAVRHDSPLVRGGLESCSLLVR